MTLRLTPAVKGLAIACVATFVVQQTTDQFFGGNLLGWLGLVPSGFVLSFRFWQIFTYVFLHGDVMHLFFNVLMLAFIGSELESVWGTRRFLRFFFACSTAAGVFYLLIQLFLWGGNGLQTPMVGASGGIYGLLVAYGILFSERTLLFMMVFPMKAKQFVWILAAIEFFTTVFSGRSGNALSGIAHLGGMAAGAAYLLGWARWKSAKRAQGAAKKPAKKPKRSSKLKLVVNNEQGFEKDDPPGDDPKHWH